MTFKGLLLNRSFLLYGICLAILLSLMKLLEWRIVVDDHTFELYAAAVAIVFTRLGIWLAKKLFPQKANSMIVEKSLNTIKTHSSRIFEKLKVQRRTQTVEKARKLNLIS